MHRYRKRSDRLSCQKGVLCLVVGLGAWGAVPLQAQAVPSQATLLGQAPIPVQAPSPAQAEVPSVAIEQTITQQIEAFRRDDVATAFGYASPSIQRMFGTAGRFGAMVEQGYPMVWRPLSYQFSDLRDIQGALWQKLIVQDQSGALFALDYRMVQIDGQWRISAVQILPAPEVSV